MARRSATDRLLRLLALPAWVAQHPDATFEAAAKHFGVTARDISRDVGTLWVSGLPGGMPDALVDFDAVAFENGRLRLTQPLGLDRPVRLTHEEAVALLLSVRVLVSLLGDQAAALRSAMSALEALVSPGQEHLEAGGARRAQDRVSEEVFAAVQRALAERRRLRLDYVTATDVRGTRLVDPLELVTDGSYLTLRAWCLSAGGERSFRLDRMMGAELCEEPAQDHRVPARTDAQQLRPVAHLRLRASGRWLVDQVPCESVVEHQDGTFTATVRGRDERWLTGLVLSAGRHLLGVEPSGLAERARAAAREALQQY